jgi:predicted DsbA family dithiol-disulfide isomerase
VRLQKIKQHYGDRVSIKWHPFALRPQYDSRPFQFSGSSAENAWKRASSLAEPENLSYTMWPHAEFPRWSMPGLEAGMAAQRQGEDLFLDFHTRLFRAFFIDSKSLIDKDNLVAVARECGLDMTAFLRDIEDKAFQDRVRQQCVEAVDTYLVSAVPTVIMGGKKRQIGMVPAEAYWQDLADLGLD